MAGIDQTAAAAPTRSRRRAAERRIAQGLAASLVLAVASGVVGVWRSIEARQRIAVITAHESQYVRSLSEIGRDVARLRGVALEEVRAESSPLELAPPRTRLKTLTTHFDQRVAFIDPEMEARGHEQGEGLRGGLMSFRQALERFTEAIERDDLAARGQALDELLVLGSRLQSTLDAVLEESRAGTMSALDSIDSELGRIAYVDAVVSLLLITGLLVVWMAVLRAHRTSSRLLAEYLARTEQANRDLDAFAGRVAHDFRNVLGPLPLLSGRLRRGRMSDLNQAADQLERVAQRGDALVSGLLAFSRLGAVPDELGASVREVLADVVDELQPLVESVGARVKLDVHDANVACAPALLHLVLANVMTNALKYLDGASERRVRVSSRAPPDAVLILIEDTGAGIPPEYLAHVFEPFFRVPGSRAEGTGLGLPTVKRIVEAVGGHVTLQSQPGTGTCVTVQLPHSRGAASPPLVDRPGDQPGDRPCDQPPMTH